MLVVSESDSEALLDSEAGGISKGGGGRRDRACDSVLADRRFPARLVCCASVGETRRRAKAG